MPTIDSSAMEGTKRNLSLETDSNHATQLSREATERASATNRFAAAQRLFKDHASASSPIAPSPTSGPLRGGRQRTNTSASLYNRLNRSVSVSSNSSLSSTSTAATSIVDEDNTSLTCAMRIRPKDTVKSTAAPALASSKDDRPVTPVDSNCILPGPRRSSTPLSTIGLPLTITTTDNKPAWYCRHDKLVVFDGIAPDGKLMTRRSRGLRNPEKVVLKVEVGCEHCRDLLGHALRGNIWMWEERCAKGSVCAECKERCHAELANMEASETVQDADMPVQGQLTYSHVDDEPTGIIGKVYEPSADDENFMVLRDVPRLRDAVGKTEVADLAKRDSMLQDEEVAIT